MDVTRRAPVPTALPPTQIAKAALRRLVLERLEPTPDNYARAYRAEGGETAAPPALTPGAVPLVERLVAGLAAQLPPMIGMHATDKLAGALAQSLKHARWDHAGRALDTLLNADALAVDAAASARLIERLLAGCERGSRQWPAGRRRESAQRVLAANRGDARRLQQRLAQLVASWDGDAPAPADGDAAPADGVAAPASGDAAIGGVVSGLGVVAPATSASAAPLTAADAGWAQALDALAATLRAALPGDAAGEGALGQAVAGAVRALAAEGPTAGRIDELATLCARAERTLQHRSHLFDQVSALCRELAASLGELAEDDSWAKGQLEAARLRLDEGLTARGVRSVSELLRRTRQQQHALREERTQARDALKSLIGRMLGDLGELGSQTDSFSHNVGRYADLVESADSLQSLTGVMSRMVEETRIVQRQVGQTQQRLHSAHERATALSARVDELEADLKRLSDEVTTDPLTRVANRRGLMQAFDAACERQGRDGDELAIALLDIDNFKRLNDELGHGTGDRALASLAGAVGGALRPGDTVARYGGEEFVVLLPGSSLAEGQQLLTGVQRALTGALFTHEQRDVFVTFSAGVTAWRPGERIEAALERADEALYEAKRTGKNRTCASP